MYERIIKTTRRQIYFGGVLSFFLVTYSYYFYTWKIADCRGEEKKRQQNPFKKKEKRKVNISHTGHDPTKYNKKCYVWNAVQ